MSRVAQQRFLIVATTLLIVAACGGDDDPIEPFVPTVASVAITPQEETLTALGATYDFNAVARDGSDRVMQGMRFVWTSSDQAVVTVDTAGVVTARALGTATITASAQGVPGHAAVTVLQEIESVEVSPAADTLTAVGDTTRYTAIGNDASGYEVLGRSLSWTSSDIDVATVDTSGLVTATGPGVAAIIAAADNVSDSALIVVDLPGSIRVSTVTVGDTLDPDGYTVDWGIGQRAIGINDTTTISDLQPGDHNLELIGLASNCSVNGANPRTAAITAGATTQTEFNVVCIGIDRIAFMTQRDGYSEIYSMYTDGSDPVNLTNLPTSDSDPEWSPDGARIAFRSNRNGCCDIYVMDADGSNPVNLTNHADRDESPTWSPDGTKIAFLRQPDGSTANSREIYVMDANGSNQARLTNNTTSELSLAWSPGGTTIAFTSGSRIYVMNTDGSNWVRLTDFESEKSCWSPDGTKIAFQGSPADGQDNEIFVINADGSNPVQLTNNAVWDGDCTWSPDGTEIAFSSTRDGNFEIYVMNADGSNPVRLTNGPDEDQFPDWSPNR